MEEEKKEVGAEATTQNTETEQGTETKKTFDEFSDLECIWLWSIISSMSENVEINSENNEQTSE